MPRDGDARGGWRREKEAEEEEEEEELLKRKWRGTDSSLR